MRYMCPPCIVFQLSANISLLFWWRILKKVYPHTPSTHCWLEGLKFGVWGLGLGFGGSHHVCSGGQGGLMWVQQDVGAVKPGSRESPGAFRFRV